MNAHVIFRGSRRSVTLGAVIAVGLITLSVAPAEATMYQKIEAYSGSDSDDFVECGLSIHLDVTFSGTFSIRAGKGDLAGAFFGHNNYEYVETWTNVDNDKFFTISANALSKDVKATHVEGSIFEFVTIETGQPFVVRDSTGKVVLRDRGALRFTYLFDTGGDNVPGGTFLEDTDLRVSGPHPGFFLDDATACEAIVSLLGD